MLCPYCAAEMKKGTITAPANFTPYWLEDGDSRSMSDFFDDKGTLPFKVQMTWKNIGKTLEAHYCPACKKLIIDADIKL